MGQRFLIFCFANIDGVVLDHLYYSFLYHVFGIRFYKFG